MARRSRRGPPPAGRHACKRANRAPIAARIDGDDDALATERLGPGGDQPRFGDSRGVDRDLVGTGLNNSRISSTGERLPRP